MTVGCGALRKGSMVVGCLFLALQPCSAQNSFRASASKTTQATRAIMVEKGHALEARGRPDLAVQVWQQVLLSDPRDTEALEGMARDLKLIDSDQAIEALNRLRAANPKDPNIAKIESLASTSAESAPARQVGEPARQGKADVRESSNPASAEKPREHVKEHPQDAELLRGSEDESIRPLVTAGIARTPAERMAFAALNEHRLEEAERRFTTLLNEEPTNARVAAGIGFLRLQQNNFAGAIQFLNRAEANGFKNPTVEEALTTARFRNLMAKAAAASNENRLDVAGATYQEALGIRPQSPEALGGLAEVLIRQQQYAQSALLYDQLTKAQPDSAEGWRGLFLCFAHENQNRKALAVEARFPAAVNAALTRDPEYLRVLAGIYLSENRTAEAQRTLAEALALPFPDNGSTLNAETKLEYAGILLEAGRYDQAVALYKKVLAGDPGNVSAWTGIVSVQHEMGQDAQAIDDVQRMPPATYEAALGDPDFLDTLGEIYKQTSHFEMAQGMLERAAKLELADGGQPSVALQLQLARIHLLRNDAEHAYDMYQQVLVGNPERTDAWNGLIAALRASHRDADAVQQIALIPAPVRKQLDGEIEFVQMEANLYASTGEMALAAETMSRVLAYYAKLHTAPPTDLEVENAWLLFNTHNDRALYGALMRLGGRDGLTVAQRETVEDIWAKWGVRRAADARDNGNIERAMDILDAASQAFPDNLTVRKAVADGYVQVGRAKESLALYRTVPMQDATADDYQGAIGAALAAGDKSQTELWLRQALQSYPRDPAILILAARFEQSRGDNQRATDYYRASLAAMPSVSPTEKLAHVLVYPEQDTSVHRVMNAGDLQHLLDPENEPFAKTTKLPPLPAYGPDPYNAPAPAGSASTASSAPKAPQTPQQQIVPRNLPPAANPSQSPSAPVLVPQSWTSSRALAASGHVHLQRSNALRLGTRPRLSGSAYRGPRLMYASFQLDSSRASAKVRKRRHAARAKHGHPHQALPVGRTGPGAPVAPHAAGKGKTRQSAIAQPATRKNRAGKPVYIASTVQTRSTSTASSSNVSAYAGRMNLPPSEETIDSTSVVSETVAFQSARPHPSPTPGAANPSPALRITSQPVGPVAAQALALFAEQTDGQLTQGSASAIHNQGNVPVVLLPDPHALRSSASQFNVAQYSPSAQQAATGAYSASKQQAVPSSNNPPPAQQCVPRVCSAIPAKRPAARHTVKKKTTHPAPQTNTNTSIPTLEQATEEPGTPPLQPTPQVGAPAEVQVLPPPPAPASETGLSDEELQQRNLPPLRGPWIHVQRQPNPLSLRDEAEMQLHSIESSYSPWLGGSGVVNDRPGSPGFDHLAAFEAPFETSMPLGYNTRVTIVARPVLLDSGQADGTSVITVQESTASSTTLVTIPQPIGTLTATATTLPAQQNAVGVGGEVQMAFPHVALAGGYTPKGFLVGNYIGRAYWKPGDGPITLNFSRDPVTDTQLSYSGLRDPNGNTPGSLAQIWGAVIANQGNIQFAHGDADSGFHLSFGGQYLTGAAVETNTRFDGSGSAHWRLKTLPEYGILSVGANFFGMHYEHNENALTHGMGGYFSPQTYFLANVPFTWVGHSGTRWHYNILGSLGVQAFQEDLTPLWPLAVDKALETAMNNAMLPARTSVGPNYDLNSQVSYQIGPHWFAGGFFSANNSRNYPDVSGGFSMHYMFRMQPSTAAGPTGLFPTDSMRPNDVLRPLAVP